MNDYCIFVSSSDNTFDIFSVVCGGVTKNWPIQDDNLFVGLNYRVAEKPFQTIGAPVSNWRMELRDQIKKLPEQYKYVILILDDFYFTKKVESKKLSMLIDFSRLNEIDYLRLKPVERSIWCKFYRLLKFNAHSSNEVSRLSIHEPYYSSLQLAIWKRSHLLKMLYKMGSIWDFELSVIDRSKHYAIDREIVNYSHLVEKGKWMPYALTLLSRYEENTVTLTRPIWAKSYLIKHLFRKFIFAVIGYGWSKIKAQFSFILFSKS